MPQIRRTGVDDVEKVAALVDGSWRRTYAPLMGDGPVASASAARHRPEQFLREIASPRVASFVAVDAQSRIVGHAMAEMMADGEVRLERLHLDPVHFGSGLAADLLHATIAAFTGEGNVMSLEVLEGNERALSFYRRQGFDIVERRGACGGIEGLPTLLMARPLPSA